MAKSQLLVLPESSSSERRYSSNQDLRDPTYFPQRLSRLRKESTSDGLLSQALRSAMDLGPAVKVRKQFGVYPSDVTDEKWTFV